MTMVVENKSSNLNKYNRIMELYTDDTIAALNTALLERKVDIEQIISVFTVPGQMMGRPAPSQFRVLYRSN
jgi:hypothetical protein